MATARATTAAVLGTVTDTAGAISGLVNTISNSLDMMNAFVRHNQEKQRFDQSIDLDNYKVAKVEEYSLAEGERKKSIADRCKDPEVMNYYNNAYSRLSKYLPQETEA
jgi:uncharacterized protein YqiB (DUF1249 family)